MDCLQDDTRAVITGTDAAHIAGPLRMRPGEPLTVCDGAGNDYSCVIERVDSAEVLLRVLEKKRSESEPSLEAHLYQALAKGDKFELIVQKAVELGVREITPVLTARCVSRPDEKSMAKKVGRYQKIAAEAAKQSGRAVIPRVHPLLPLNQALSQMAEYELPLLFYEAGGRPLRETVSPALRRVALLVGSEGGFEPEEVDKAAACGVRIATLGPRILRCETAPLAALSVLMALTGNM